MKIKKETLVRTVVLGVALFNQILVANGKSIFPIEQDELAEMVGWGFTTITAIIAWWKNNSFTQAAIKADEYMYELKEKN